MLRIRQIREIKEIDQAQLAKESGISQGYLSELESGVKENPSIMVLNRIALALCVPVIALFEDTQLKASGE